MNANDLSRPFPQGNFQIVYGDIFTQDVDAIVNPVNCKGAMGAGLALEFKRRYPTMFAQYATACREGRMRPGILDVYRLDTSDSRKFIVNIPTKDHWRDPSTIAYVSSGLTALADLCTDLSIRSIATPALGCGLGGLSLKVVKPLIEQFAATAATVQVRLVLSGKPT